jgi:hypothetical protein
MNKHRRQLICHMTEQKKGKDLGQDLYLAGRRLQEGEIDLGLDGVADVISVDLGLSGVVGVDLGVPKNVADVAVGRSRNWCTTRGSCSSSPSPMERRSSRTTRASRGSSPTDAPAAAAPVAADGADDRAPPASMAAAAVWWVSGGSIEGSGEDHKRMGFGWRAH